MTWAEIKTMCQTIYGQYVGTGKLIDDSNGDSSNPSSLALLLHLVNNRIASYPNEFNFLRETGTISLTGATTYNLKTLFPDLKNVYQVYGITSYQEHNYYPNSEANITPLDGYTVKDNSLIFTGSAPTGTASIQYKSKYMVKSSAGVRKMYFLDDDDYSVLDDSDINALIFGLVDFINWQSDSETGERKKEIKGWYTEAFNNLILNNKQSKQLNSLL